MSATRRALLASVLTLVALTLPQGGAAQDPRASLAQQAAREWLLLADRSDAAASWKAASPAFRQALTEAQWSRALLQVREPLGAVVSRTLSATQFLNEVPNLPKGEYALLVFRTVFANKEGRSERLTMVKDSDGVWRVAGYVIS